MLEWVAVVLLAVSMTMVGGRQYDGFLAAGSESVAQGHGEPPP
jgi:hypothetical protein